MHKENSILKSILPLLSCTVLLFSGCNFNDNSGSNSSSSNLAAETTSTATTTSTVTAEITDYNSSTELDISSWSNSYSPNTSTRDITSDASSYDDVTFSATLYINLSTLQVSADNSTWTGLTNDGDEETVTLGGTAITANISDNVLYVDSSSYKSNLKFDITGTAATGALNISSYKKGTIALYLHDAVISSSGNYPCINVDAKSTVYLQLEGTNSLTDGRTYGTGYSQEEGTDFYTSSYTGDTSDTDLELTAKWAKGDNTKGSLYTKGALLIGGSGSLSVTEDYKHAIYSKDYIRIFGGTINVNTSGRNALQAVNGFIMEDGAITISGTGTNTNNQSRGIIVEGSEDEDYAGEGFIVINGGTITSTTVGKGMSAKWDYEDDVETEDTADDPYPYVLINGGTISITTTGTPIDEDQSSEGTFTDADGVSTEETIKLSPEGIEGKQAVFISGGIVTLNCTDDCINASRDDEDYAGQIIINGGNIYAYSSSNDAIDSNGTLTINGGVIVALTSTTPECAFDCDDNTFAITGGLLVGAGTSNYSNPTAASCTQSTVVLSGTYFGAGSTTFALEDSSSSPVFAFTLPSIFGSSANSSYIMIFSSPDIKTDTTYKAVTNVTATGGSTFNNLFTELPSVSGGTTTASEISTSSSGYVYTKTSSQSSSSETTKPGSSSGTGPGGR